jgi:hypothetical protein
MPADRPKLAGEDCGPAAHHHQHGWVWLWATVRAELALSWLSCYRRLQVCWDRGSGRWFAFVLVACALGCLNRC